MIGRYAAVAATLFFLDVAPGEAAPLPAAMCDAPKALHFAPGTHSGEVSGGIARGELACWTVSAEGGQTMHAQVDSTGGNAVLQIYQPGWKIAKADGDYRFAGPALAGVAEGDDAKTWQGVLPRSGALLIVVGNSSGGGDYALKVSVTDVGGHSRRSGHSP